MADASFGITRRTLLQASGGIALGLWANPLHAEEPSVLPATTLVALASSPLVYVSPIRSDGSESRCHGEVWFTFDKGDVLIATSVDAWKALSVGKGLTGTHIWVGDFGPVRRAGDKFRRAPHFQATARLDKDPSSFERLMVAFAAKYPDEWGKWKPRFREGYTEGSRILIRYTPNTDR